MIQKKMIKEVTVEGLKVVYSLMKPKTKSRGTLIFLHGWGGTKESWDKNISSLSKTHRCITLDLPGFGKSDTPNKPWGTFEYADFVKKFLKAIGIKSPTLIGKSFGGRVAIVFASKWPDELKDLILVSSAGIEEKEFYLRLKILILKSLGFLIKTIPFVSENKIRGYVYQRLGLRLESDYKREVKKIVTNQDLTDLLDDIKSRTLIVWGSEDQILPLEVGEKLATRINNSELVVIENGDHWVHEKHSAEFNQIVSEFL